MSSFIQENLPFIIVGFIYFAPPIWVLLSGRSHGGAKLGWFLLTLFFSWLGLAIFLIVTQPLGNRPGKKPAMKTDFLIPD
jgi:hypothetical protein